MDKEKRYKIGKRITWTGVVSNFALSLLKFGAGTAGRSEALIADAAHSLADLFTDLVVLISLKFSKKPVDEARPYGYGRVETVGTGALGIILIATGIGIFWDALTTIRGDINYTPTSLALAAALVSIVSKEAMYQYTARAGRKIDSPAIMANAWHHRSDAISSVASLIGIGAAMMGWPIFDPLAAMAVTLLILKVGWNIAKSAFFDIIDTAVKEDIRVKIIAAALEIPGAINYHDLKTRKTGSDILVDIHIEVNPLMNVSEAHSIADAVRESIMKKVRSIADVLVHIDPEGEIDGITYSKPKDEIINEIEMIATGTKGVVDCSRTILHYIGDDIIANLTLSLSSDITIREGYETVAMVKKKLLEMDQVVDAVISVDHS